VSGEGDRVVGTEGPRGHEAGVPTRERRVPMRIFAFIGVFLVVVGIIYWTTSSEQSGTVMLFGAAILGVWIATYLWLQFRAEEDESVRALPTARAQGEREASPHGGMYLPHASAWPFAIGLGGATVANGLVLGLWVTVPGLALLLLGILGFVRQSRRRD
jgi:Cytochrome c oxidase subunit IV